MFQSLLPIHTQTTILNNRAFQKIWRFFWDWFTCNTLKIEFSIIFGKIDRVYVALIQLFIGIDHHKVNDAQWPYVCLSLDFFYLKSISLTSSNFRSYSRFSAAICLLFLNIGILNLFAETEISDFEDIIVNENIGWFQITMDNVVAMQFLNKKMHTETPSMICLRIVTASSSSIASL